MADPTGATTSDLRRHGASRLTVPNPADKRISYAYDALGRRDRDGRARRGAVHLLARRGRAASPGWSIPRPADHASPTTPGPRNAKELANGTVTTQSTTRPAASPALTSRKSDGEIISQLRLRATTRSATAWRDGRRGLSHYLVLRRPVPANERATRGRRANRARLGRPDRRPVGRHDRGRMGRDGSGASRPARPATTSHYTYDPVGNRLVQDGRRANAQHTPTTPPTRSSPARNSPAPPPTPTTPRATWPSSSAPSGRTTNTWDIENRLTKVELPGAIVNTMLYNADGLRVQKDDSTGTTKFLWDLQNVLLEFTVGGATQALFTLQPDLFGNLLSQRRGANSSFYHFDALGSTAGLTDSDQLLSSTYMHDAFGRLVAGTDSANNPFRWVGRLGYAFDSDLLQDHVRRRQYDPRIARWLSQDPLGLASGVNFFEYVRSRPVIATDPEGLVNPYQSPEAPTDPVPFGNGRILNALAIGLAACVGGGTLGIILDSVGNSIRKGTSFHFVTPRLVPRRLAAFFGLCSASAIVGVAGSGLTLGASLAAASPLIAGCGLLALMLCTGCRRKPWFCL